MNNEVKSKATRRVLWAYVTCFLFQSEKHNFSIKERKKRKKKVKSTNFILNSHNIGQLLAHSFSEYPFAYIKLCRLQSDHTGFAYMYMGNVRETTGVG